MRTLMTPDKLKARMGRYARKRQNLGLVLEKMRNLLSFSREEVKRQKQVSAASTYFDSCIHEHARSTASALREHGLTHEANELLRAYGEIA